MGAYLWWRNHNCILGKCYCPNLTIILSDFQLQYLYHLSDGSHAKPVNVLRLKFQVYIPVNLNILFRLTDLQTSLEEQMIEKN